MPTFVPDKAEAGYLSCTAVQITDQAVPELRTELLAVAVDFAEPERTGSGQYLQIHS